MGTVTKATPHLTLAEIDERIKKCQEAWRVRRWMVIRHALVDPAQARVIGEHVGLAKQTVHNLISAYNRYGLAALETPGRGQRQRAYLSLEEEKAFLERFTQKSEMGQITTVSEIKEELEKELGHVVALSTVSRIIQRQQWRKIVPRPHHPQADEAEQEDFKKTSLRGWHRR